MGVNNSIFLDTLQDDLLISAPIFYELVNNNPCNYYDGVSFDWYHKAWQYLRIIDKVSTPTWHFDFYSDFFKSSIKNDSNILISGTADYSMLSIIINVAKELNIKPNITIIDICPAPLKICEWYANKEKFDIETIKLDILKEDFSFLKKFDIIATDAFLTRFNKANKKSILSFWKNILKKDGAIITTVRIDEALPYVNITNDEKKRFITEVVNEYNKSNLNYNIEINKIASDYISNIKSFSYHSSSELSSELTFNDFEIVKFDDAQVKGEAKKSYYKRIIMKNALQQSI